MTILGPSTDYTGASVNQGQKKTFIAAMRALIADRVGPGYNLAPENVASASNVDLSVLNTRQANLTGTTQVNTVTAPVGLSVTLKATGAIRLAAAVTGTSADIVLAAGDTWVWRATAADTMEVVHLVRAVSTIPRDHIAGLTMSTAGSSATMSIAAGQAADSTNTVLMSLSAINKTTSAWSVGNAAGGKAQTGAVANSTWYHFYEIRRPDTGVTDVAFSTNAAGLLAADFVVGGGNVPDAYTQFRRIGSGLTNSSAQWVKFFQDGDIFQWDVSVLDVSASNPGTASVLRTMSTPLGIKAGCQFRARAADSGLTSAHKFSDPQTTDIAASLSGVPGSDIGANSVAGEVNYGRYEVQTNTSSQIRTTAFASGASTALQLITLGYRDSRGRG